MIRKMILGCSLVFAIVSVAPAEDARAKATTPTNPQFERLKKLVGTWMEVDKDGKPTDKVASVIRLTAGGSVIEETIFPGTPMEMLSMYHLDKGDLVMTHYCMLGNQPKLKADPKSAANTIHWQFTGGTNLDVTKDLHMHESTLKFVDDDHIEVAGVAWVNGKPAEDHCGTMKFVRKK